ncbi:MAG: 50S ribosomal protein L35 [Syntrophomonadaceae bacterium]|nr:50S ribosomal protein L35 [Syntrophomonadaceae bacterium]
MPKMKTHRGAAKRFKKTGKGKIKRACAFHSHLLSSKTSKRKRRLRKGGYTSAADTAKVAQLIPYK